jgi:hypothetical protein
MSASGNIQLVKCWRYIQISSSLEVTKCSPTKIRLVEFRRENVTLLKSFQTTSTVKYGGTKYRSVRNVDVTVKRRLIVREAWQQCRKFDAALFAVIVWYLWLILSIPIIPSTVVTVRILCLNIKKLRPQRVRLDCISCIIIVKVSGDYFPDQHQWGFHFIETWAYCVYRQAGNGRLSII